MSGRSPWSSPRWFVCAQCDHVFCTEWTEAAAVAEYNAQFPEHVNRAKVEVCPDCYLAILHDQGITPRH